MHNNTVDVLYSLPQTMVYPCLSFIHTHYNGLEFFLLYAHHYIINLSQEKANSLL